MDFDESHYFVPFYNFKTHINVFTILVSNEIPSPKYNEQKLLLLFFISVLLIWLLNCLQYILTKVKRHLKIS